MMKCSEATRKIEQMKFEDIGWWGQLKVRLHLLICFACRNYLKDSQAIDRMIHRAQDKLIKTYSTEEKSDLINQLP